MDIQLEKFRLIEALMKVDDANLISEIRGMLEGKEEPILGFDIHGNSISKSQLIKDIERAEERMDSGELISQEQLEKESENW